MPLEQLVGESGQTVGSVLLQKHPDAQSVRPEAVISWPETDVFSRPFHPALFEQLTGDLRSAALRIEGAAGSSGLDTMQWRRLCASFRKSSRNLCDAVATFAHRLATNYVDPVGLAAYVACRLVPLYT